jgi:hypothetical protein
MQMIQLFFFTRNTEKPNFGAFIKMSLNWNFVNLYFLLMKLIPIYSEIPIWCSHI